MSPVAFEEFTAPTSASRLVLSYATTGASWLVILTVAVLAAHYVGLDKITKPDQDELVEVKLVAEIPTEQVKEPEPEPPPPAPAPPPPAAPAALVVPKTIKVAVNTDPIKPPEVPLEVPKGPLKEDDPSKDLGVAGVHEGQVGDGKTGGAVGGKGHTPGASATVAPKAPEPVAPKPTAPPKPKVAIAPEGSEPADCSGMPRASYPEEARNAGLEGDVIVKCLITETGALEQCKVLKGDPVFHSNVLGAVQGFRCKSPYTLEGKPIAAGKVFKFKMRINQ